MKVEIWLVMADIEIHCFVHEYNDDANPKRSNQMVLQKGAVSSLIDETMQSMFTDAGFFNNGHTG
jgi:tmRNA-binding protein